MSFRVSMPRIACPAELHTPPSSRPRVIRRTTLLHPRARVSSGGPGFSVLAPGVSSRASCSSVLPPCVSTGEPVSSVLAPCVSSGGPRSSVLAPYVSTGEPGSSVLVPGVSSRASYSSVLAPCVSTGEPGSSVLVPGVSTGGPRSSVLAPCVSSRAPSLHRTKPRTMSAKDLLRRLARPWRQHLLGQTSLTGDPSRSLQVVAGRKGWALWMTRTAQGRRSMKPWRTRTARGRRSVVRRLTRGAGGQRRQARRLTRGARGGERYWPGDGHAPRGSCAPDETAASAGRRVATTARRVRGVGHCERHATCEETSAWRMRCAGPRSLACRVALARKACLQDDRRLGAANVRPPSC